MSPIPLLYTSTIVVTVLFNTSQYCAMTLHNYSQSMISSGWRQWSDIVWFTILFLLTFAISNF